jgi:hypothetical protein
MSKRESEFRPAGAKLRVRLTENGEVEVVGNRLGLRALSKICASLSESVGEKGNHYHFMDVEGFWGTEPGSISLTIYGEEL